MPIRQPVTKSGKPGAPCLLALALMFPGCSVPAQTVLVPKFSVHETSLRSTGNYANPYTELTAEAVLTEPDGKGARTVPLFWDGGATWRFRFSPDKTGTWKWTVKSMDTGLNGKSGTFQVVESQRKGGLRPMHGAPMHFEREDGSPFWFMGDTAWALVTDSETEKHDREAAKRYIDVRAGQGFNVIHMMMLSEAGWGNRGGKPFTDLAEEKINPGYWQEADLRIAYANTKDIVCALAIAWGDKRKQEPFAWRKFPSLEARQRYARYMAARYSAFEVYFIVSGEWHGEARTRPSTEADMRTEFTAIGDALRAADPHGRMAAIHPMTQHGSVREFNEAKWMSFGDYQQNYHDLHSRLLASRTFNKPVVNSEYGYHLRDQSGDGVPDKDNSTSLEAIRHATWDIVMAGGYVVTGFGTTYFGGNRDPGPFDLLAERNKRWEQQMTAMKMFFTQLDWGKLTPQDELAKCVTPRGNDRKELGRTAPPRTTYWCMAEPGKQYVLYARGLKDTVTLTLAGQSAPLRASQFNPRTGETQDLGPVAGKDRFEFRPPDEEDWLVVLK